MSFHAIYTAVRPTSFQWITRLVLPLVVSVVVVTTTGCSMVMGILGTSEADITGVEPEPTRLLQPTPIGQAALSAEEREQRNGPTPTPFIMRPAAQLPSAVTYTGNNSAGNNSSLTNSSLPNTGSRPNRLRVIIRGDSVNLRNAPGLDTQVVATQARDTAFEYVDETAAGDWIQVCCVDNQLAWVYAELVTKEQATAATTGQPSVAGTALNQATATLGQSNSAPQETTTTDNRIQNLAQTLTGGNGIAALGLNSAGAPTRFTAAEDGFAITLPATWLPLAESSTIIQSSIAALQNENPAMATLLQDQLTALSNIPIALIAFDLSPETLSSGFATNINVMRQPVPAGFPLEFLVQFSADQLEQVLGLSDAATSTKVMLPAGETIMLDYQLNDQAVARQYYLLHNQMLYIVTFSASASLADASLATFNEMMQSFAFASE